MVDSTPSVLSAPWYKEVKGNPSASPKKLASGKVRSSNLARFAYFLTIAFGLATLCLEIWAIPRGFDMTDEGFHYQYYSHPDHYEATVSSDYLYSGRIFSMTGQSVIAMRCFSLILYICVTWIFSQGLLAYLQKEWNIANPRLHSHAIHALAFTGCMPAGWFERSMAYNTWTTLSILVTIGCLLQSLYGKNRRKSLLFAGMALGICFFIKFPAGLAAIFLSLLCCSYLFRSLKQVANSTKWIFSGFAIWTCIHFIVFIEPGDWMNRFKKGWAFWGATRTSTHSTELLIGYIHEGWILFQFIIKSWIPIGVLACVAIFTRNKVLIGVSITIATACLAWECIKSQFWRGGDNLYVIVGGVAQNYLLIILVSLTFASVVAIRSRNLLRACKSQDLFQLKNWATLKKTCLARKWGLLFVLCLFPLAGAAGTNTALSAKMCFLLPCWCLAIYVIILFVARSLRISWLHLAILSILSTVSFSQNLSGRLGKPYRVPTSLVMQSHPIRVGPGKCLLLVDEATADFHKKLVALFEKSGFQPGDEIISIFSIGSGYSFWLGGVSPINPWTTDVDLLQEVASNIDHARKKNCYFILQKNDPDIRLSLDSIGFPFSTGYRKLGELDSPYWIPRPLEFWGPQ